MVPPGTELLAVLLMVLTANAPQSLQGRVLRFLASQPWALQQHATWPPAFKAAVCTLLCCAHRQPPAGAGTGLWSLPLPLLQHIVELLAGSRLDWLRTEAVPGSAQQGATAGGT